MTKVAVEAVGLAHPEGPSLHPDGSILFVETYRERVSRWRRGENVSSYSLCGGGPNACCVGSDGVYVTQMGARVGRWTSSRPTLPSIQKIGWDGTVSFVATVLDGRRLTAPNDLCFGPNGHLYFTDPDVYSETDPKDGFICSLSPDGSCDFMVNIGPVFPNGIVALPDDSVVWVESYTRQVRRRFRDGTIRLIATCPPGHMPDGFKADADGRLHITTIMSGGLDVVPLGGGEPEFLATGGMPLNCLFVGESLYVTDDGPAEYDADGATRKGRLLCVEVNRGGMATYAGAIASLSPEDAT